MTDKTHIPNIAAATVAQSKHLRYRVAYAIAQTAGDPEGMEPASCDYEMADAVIDLLIDMAGHGELLKAIDRMHRE